MKKRAKTILNSCLSLLKGYQTHWNSSFAIAQFFDLFVEIIKSNHLTISSDEYESYPTLPFRKQFCQQLFFYSWLNLLKGHQINRNSSFVFFLGGSLVYFFKALNQTLDHDQVAGGLSGLRRGQLAGCCPIRTLDGFSVHSDWTKFGQLFASKALAAFCNPAHFVRWDMDMKVTQLCHSGNICVKKYNFKLIVGF